MYRRCKEVQPQEARTHERGVAYVASSILASRETLLFLEDDATRTSDDELTSHGVRVDMEDGCAKDMRYRLKWSGQVKT